MFLSKILRRIPYLKSRLLENISVVIQQVSGLVEALGLCSVLALGTPGALFVLFTPCLGWKACNWCDFTKIARVILCRADHWSHKLLSVLRHLDHHCTALLLVIFYFHEVLILAKFVIVLRVGDHNFCVHKRGLSWKRRAFIHQN